MTSCAWLWNEAVSASLPDPTRPTPTQPQTNPNKNGLLRGSCLGKYPYGPLSQTRTDLSTVLVADEVDEWTGAEGVPR